MSDQMELDVDNHARARRTDPETSHEAAASITPSAATLAHHYLLALFQVYGAMTDQEAWDRYSAQVESDAQRDVPRMSPSGFRTRRSELVARGKLRDSGERQRLASGYKAIVWAAVV